MFSAVISTTATQLFGIKEDEAKGNEQENATTTVGVAAPLGSLPRDYFGAFIRT